ADGRLLPGVTRAAMLRIARENGLPVRETPLRARRLPDASEVFVTNSVQGVVPVRSLAGTSPSAPGRPGKPGRPGRPG
ncbi:MAG: aminotransferase class IV, partial [Streptosporangiaceae bacterium]